MSPTGLDRAAGAAGAVVPAPPRARARVRARARARTLGMLGLLGLTLPVDAAITAAALARRAAVGPAPRQVAARPRTVLVSGGKMTKALVLARAFHRAGHRVVMVEQGRYRLTGHRFSACVDAFHVVPDPDDPGYAAALLEVVQAEGVDVYVPVCSPLASRFDALAGRVLAGRCEVVHPDPATVVSLDDKDTFAALAASMGLPVPATHRITDPAQVAAFDFGAHPGRWLLKSIAYDPVNRSDLTALPRPTAAETAAFAASKPISADNPWILQSFVTGREHCAHATVRRGRVTAWVVCESSGFQINYAPVHAPAIRAWVERFVAELGLTGQVCFDVVVTDDGDLRAIECNPRAHSAITLLADQGPALARACLDDDAPVVEPAPGTRATYWIYHEVWRLLTRRGRLARLASIARGRDAVLDADDPWPFFMLHHAQIPSLLLGALVRGQDWVRIDLNIGKLVQEGGD